MPLLDIKDLLLAAPSASICLTHLLPVLILEEVAAHTLPVLTVAGSSMGPSALPSRPYRPLSGTLAPVDGRSLIASHGLTQAGPASPGPLRFTHSNELRYPALDVRDGGVDADAAPLPGGGYVHPVTPSSPVPIGSYFPAESTVHPPAAEYTLSPASRYD